MRTNCRKAVTAFERGCAAKPASSIWTDGDTIYSYGAPLAAVIPGDGRVVFNRQRYSVTTTTHQNALAAHFADRMFTVESEREFHEILDTARRYAALPHPDVTVTLD